MAFIPIPNTAQVRVQYLLDNQKIENVWYSQNVTEWSESTLTELATTYLTWATDTLMPLMSNRLALSRVVARDMTTDAGIEVVVSPSSSVTGGINSINLPNNVTFAVHKVGTIGGRHAKARVYVPCLIAGNLTSSNTLFTSDADAFVSAFSVLLTDVATEFSDAVNVCWVTLVDAGVPLTEGIPHAIVGFSYTDTTIDAQRRRLPRRGQ